MTAVSFAKIERKISAAQKRAERIRAGMHSFIATRKEIAAAYADRDWVTLGYTSFEEYVEHEFSETRLRLTPDERREAVAELRLTGMSQRGISAALGVSQSTVRDDLAELSTSTQFPDRVASADGKDRPSTRPTPKTPGSADAATTPPADPGTTPAPDAAPSTAPTGSGPTPAPVADAPVPRQEPAEPERHLRAVPDPTQVEAERMETQRVQIVERARRRAPRLVAEIRDLITEVLAGINLGETGLVTPQAVADIRALVDALEARMEATQ